MSHRLVSSAALAAALISCTACSADTQEPATDAAAVTEAETAAPQSAPVEAAAAEPAAADTPMPAEEDHDHEAHDHGDDHDHGEEKDPDHEAHDHDHDHDHGDGTALEAHVHGAAEASIVIDGDQTLSVDLVAPLANFGLPESGPDVPDDAAFAAFVAEKTSVFTVTGGTCDGGDTVTASVDQSGDHAVGTVTIERLCADTSAIESVDFTVLTDFDGFERLDVIAISGSTQAAGSLSADETAFDLP